MEVPVLKVPKVVQEQVLKEMLVLKEHKASKEMPVHKELKVIEVHRVIPVEELRAIKGSLVNKVPMLLLEHKALQVLLEHRAILVQMVLPELRALKVAEVHKVLLE